MGSRSGAQLYIDNKYKGLTPITEEMIKGTYQISVQKEGYTGETINKKIEKDETIKMTLKTTPQGPEMVLVKSGTFQMGNTRNDGEGDSDEKPVHTVKLTYDYYIGKYEVKFEEYDRYCEDTGKSKPSDHGWGRGKRPVININWWDATEYCNWLSKKEGIAEAYDSEGNLLDSSGRITTDITKVKGYRLPTEAEWEYAARGAQNSIGDYKYSGSNNLNEVGWYNENLGNKTQEVGLKKPNELGIYDMSGNVWEWCHDWYDSNYYSKSPKTNPIGPNNRSSYYRVIRGGSWADGSSGLRVTSRGSYWGYDVYYYNNLGFRLSRTR